MDPKFQGIQPVKYNLKYPNTFIFERKEIN